MKSWTVTNVTASIFVCALLMTSPTRSFGVELTGLPPDNRSVRAAREFTFTPIDVPGSSQTVPYGIDNRGEVVGIYRVTGIQDAAMFKWDTGLATNIILPSPPTKLYPSVSDVNNAGEIVGAFTEAGNTYGFVLANGVLTTIDVPGSLMTLSARGINDRGQIVGAYSDALGTLHGYLLNKGEFTTIDYPGSQATVVDRINNIGQMVGTFADSGGLHAFLLDDGVFTAFDAPGSSGFTHAYGLNDRGDVVGTYSDARFVNHGYLLHDGVFTEVTVPDAETAIPMDINNRAEIAGYYPTAGTYRGFLLTPGNLLLAVGLDGQFVGGLE